MSLEYPCIYHHKGKCSKFTEDGYDSWCVMGPCSYETPSRGDQIRRMTDEEIARLALRLNATDEGIGFCRNLPECQEKLDQGEEIPEERCVQCLVSWLQEPGEREGL